ncbi:uncharacterized protein LOC111878591 [Lactuca sativa]|uniref:uncharacterized protein LOC111878591 n=1 Tax=Lactuca sativa TaxID=4236 RepID=UPI0022AE89A5|nr:uncharacterized protein LOC111878591 [Lactuca sativa]
MSLEDIVKSLATSTQAFQQETKASIKNLEKQVSQLATSISKLDSQGKLPAKTETNPRHNVCAITLRGGKSYDGPKVSVDQKEEERVVEEATKEEKKEEKTIEKKPFIAESKATPAPFPERLKSTKKEREENEIMQMFKRVQINIPLLEAIKQVPRYARFLKDLCVSKKKLKGNQVITVGEHGSAVLQKRMPPKCKDPGVFTVPCKLGNLHVPRAMLNLGASINVLPYSLFKSIGVGTLSKNGVIIKLADRSLVHPKGVLEDVLLQVDEFIFPADFYVLDMGDDDSPSSSSILLGRPFLKTSKTKFDVYNGTLSMEFDGQGKLDRDKAKELAKEVDMDNEVLESFEFIDDKKHVRSDDIKPKPSTKVKILPLVEQALDPGAKTPPNPLKLIHVEKESTQTLINSNKLSKKAKNELITLLNKYQKGTKWIISDIKGLSPFCFMRKKKAKGRLKVPLKEVARRLMCWRGPHT